MTNPVTPNPSIHNPPAKAKNQSGAINQLRTLIGQLPQIILSQVIAYIKNATGLDLTWVFNILTTILGFTPGSTGTSGDFWNNIPLIGTLIHMFDPQSTATGTGGLQAEIQNLMKMVGQPPNLSGTAPGGFDLFGALQNLLKQLEGAGAVTTNNPAPPSQYAALAPVASVNKLRDPKFSGPTLVQGQSDWMWDSPAVPHFNSVRTVRTGLLTVYYVGGTYTDLFGNEPPLIPFNQWMWMGVPQDVQNIGGGIFPPGCSIDTTHCEFINIPYPGKAFPMDTSIQAGTDYVCQLIDQIPGPFYLCGLSQGSSVISNVYDELRTGRLQHRRSDFVGGHADCNPRHQQGHTFIDPTYGHWPDPAPTKSGMQLPNLTDCEDIWWETYRGDDIVSCCENDPNGANYAVDQFIRTEFGVVNEQWNGIFQIILSGPLGWIEAFQAFMAIYNDVFIPTDPSGTLTPHHQFWGGPDSAKPFFAQGDDRYAAQIMCDRINQLSAELITPPAVGLKHQCEGELFAVGPGAIVIASADVMWINVDVPMDYVSLFVGVNAYDSNGALIGTVTAAQATVIGAQEYQVTPRNLKADFVMPAGTVNACIVFDVEPETMTSGIVWFGNADYEITGGIMDAAQLTNLENIAQIDPTKIGGPMDQADLATAFENLIAGQAAALKQTGLSSTQLAELFAAQGQNATNLAQALELAIQSQQELSNTETQPLYQGLQPTGESTFPLTNFPQGSVMPNIAVSAGTAIAGIINCQKAVKKGFIEFEAKGPGSGSGVYVNVYSIDSTTGLWTKLWTSADISSQIPSGSYGWVSVLIPSPYIPVTPGEFVVIELACVGMAINVAAGTWPHANNPSTIPPNIGASRNLASTGGTSPSTIAQTSITFSSNVPYFVFGIKAIPVIYQPPDRVQIQGAGVHYYTIPGWIQAGNLIDVVGVGAGATGGAANGFFTVNLGQGGGPASWGHTTLNYGTDIPTSVTQLVCINGTGATATSSDGGTTIIGYGTLSTPAFDAVGVGNSTTSGTTLSWTHTATAGAYALVFVDTSYGTFDVKYDGVTMHPLGVAYLDNNGGLGGVFAYGLANVPGGAKTVTVTTPSSANITANSVSYTGVSSAAQTTSAYGFGTTMTQATTVQANQMVAQAFGTWNSPLSTFSGGSQRTYRVNSSNGFALSISDASANTTFTAGVSGGGSDHWSGLSIALNPQIQHTLVTAAGGAAGGPGGSTNYNPANSNTGANGLGPGDLVFGGRTYFGGVTVSSAAAGASPGGSSGGGGSSGPPAAGADGSTWFTSRQS